MNLICKRRERKQNNVIVVYSLVLLQQIFHLLRPLIHLTQRWNFIKQIVGPTKVLCCLIYHTDTIYARELGSKACSSFWLGTPSIPHQLRRKSTHGRERRTWGRWRETAVCTRIIFTVIAITVIFQFEIYGTHATYQFFWYFVGG